MSESNENAESVEETSPKEAPKPTPPAKETDASEVRLPDDHPLVTALATLKSENKALKAAMDSEKTDAEKNAERLSQVEQRAIEAEARAMRRDVALEFRLPKEDAGLLDAITDEEAMRALAGRLSAESDKKRNHVPREGNTPSETGDDARDFLRRLTGRD